MSAFLTDQEAASSSSIPQAITQPQPSPSSTDASLREILDQLRTLTLNQPNPNTEAPVVENPAREVEVLDGLPPLQKVKLPFPPRYDGTREVAVINAWIDSITDYFLLTQIQDGYQVRVAAQLLTGSARKWYVQWKDQRQLQMMHRNNGSVRMHQGEISFKPHTEPTWEVFRVALKHMFTPPHHIRQCYDKLASMSQTG